MNAVVLHLHSTMFLLILSSLQQCGAVKHIYIPLCFYLYDHSRYMQLSPLIYLHSTMFLLIRYSGRSQHGSMMVFTFHYVSTYTVGPVDLFVLLISIYIPLCFYLYRELQLYRCSAFPFTFHYVSTYTNSREIKKGGLINLHSTMFLLIRSVLGSATQDILNLHSTMFLLILNWKDWEGGVSVNLHSTMFLLIPEPCSTMLSTDCKFTFHYVSTYTNHRLE